MTYEILILIAVEMVVMQYPLGNVFQELIELATTDMIEVSKGCFCMRE